MNLSLNTATDATNNNDIMVVNSNCDSSTDLHATAMNIAPHHTIANTGAMSIFVMAGTPADNIRNATHPIHISLPYGKKIVSMQVCDINITGLPITLTGHSVPG